MHNTEDDENPPPLGFVATQPAWLTQVQAQNTNDGLMDYDEDAHGTCDDDGPPELGPDAETKMLQEYYAAAVRQNKETEVLPEFGSLEHESASQYGIDPSDDYWELPRHVRALLTRNTPAIVSFQC